jgi:hypothetical protein
MRKALLTLAFGAIILPLGIAQTAPTGSPAASRGSGPPDPQLGPPWRQNMGTTAPKNRGSVKRSESISKSVTRTPNGLRVRKSVTRHHVNPSPPR